MEQANSAEFYELGLGEPILISAEHAQGIDELIKHTLVLLPKEKKKKAY